MEELDRWRYKSSAQYAQVLVMARLSGWLAGEGLGASDLTPAVLGRFIAELGTRGYRNPRSLRGFGTLLGYLRRVGTVPVPAPPAVLAPATAEEELLDRYLRYLTGERGVCEQVARAYVRKVRRFLDWRARVGGAGLEGLTAAEVSAFVLAECTGRSTRVGGDLTLALRSFLVFLHVDGVLAQSLAAAVPRVAGWRLAGLPRPLDPGVVQQLVASCDLGGVIGRRDRAILLLLWRLALRRGEVAAMMLDDLDWRAGELRVCGKSRRVEVLPLPWDVGEALAEYVRDDRPRVEGRAVFVAVNAPHGPLTPATVGRVVADAARRAGVSGVTAHRLRHTAATEMLREGASLIEIGQVLRHRRTQTTAIYAKVDVETLRSVARAWPGGRVMTSLHDGLADYLQIRRGEGVKFKKIGLALEHFVEFLEERGAERVTVELAVEWATLPTQASDRHRANRLTMVRGFAAYLRERDPANEVAPWGLLPSGKPRTGRPRRRPVDTAPAGLRAALADYLRIRRALGYKLTKDERALRNFVAFLDACGAVRVTTELALDWATLPENAHPASLANRLTMVRQFAGYLQTIDPATEVPPSRLLRAGNRRATPYIYTESEIAALIDATAMLRYPLGVATYRTLIGLLAVSGLRVGEAIRLDTADIDSERGLLIVRDTKFGKTRLVPLHSTATDALDRSSDPSTTRSMLGTKLITQLLPQGQQDEAEPSTPQRTARTR